MLVVFANFLSQILQVKFAFQIVYDVVCPFAILAQFMQIGKLFQNIFLRFGTVICILKLRKQVYNTLVKWLIMLFECVHHFIDLQIFLFSKQFFTY